MEDDDGISVVDTGEWRLVFNEDDLRPDGYGRAEAQAHGVPVEAGAKPDLTVARVVVEVVENPTRPVEVDALAAEMAHELLGGPDAAAPGVSRAFGPEVDSRGRPALIFLPASPVPVNDLIAGLGIKAFDRGSDPGQGVHPGFIEKEIELPQFPLRVFAGICRLAGLCAARGTGWGWAELHFFSVSLSDRRTRLLLTMNATAQVPASASASRGPVVPRDLAPLLWQIIRLVVKREGYGKGLDAAVVREAADGTALKAFARNITPLLLSDLYGAPAGRDLWTVLWGLRQPGNASIDFDAVADEVDRLAGGPGILPIVPFDPPRLGASPVALSPASSDVVTLETVTADGESRPGKKQAAAAAAAAGLAVSQARAAALSAASPTLASTSGANPPAAPGPTAPAVPSAPAVVPSAPAASMPGPLAASVPTTALVVEALSTAPEAVAEAPPGVLAGSKAVGKAATTSVALRGVLWLLAGAALMSVPNCLLDTPPPSSEPADDRWVQSDVITPQGPPSLVQALPQALAQALPPAPEAEPHQGPPRVDSSPPVDSIPNLRAEAREPLSVLARPLESLNRHYPSQVKPPRAASGAVRSSVPPVPEDPLSNRANMHRAGLGQL